MRLHIWHRKKSYSSGKAARSRGVGATASGATPLTGPTMCTRALAFAGAPADTCVAASFADSGRNGQTDSKGRGGGKRDPSLRVG